MAESNGVSLVHTVASNHARSHNQELKEEEANFGRQEASQRQDSSAVMQAGTLSQKLNSRVFSPLQQQQLVQHI